MVIPKALWVLLCTLLVTGNLVADARMDLKELESVRANISVLLPDNEIGAIRQSVIPGLYEVAIEQQILYISGDGRYLFRGELVDLEQQKSLTAPRLQTLKLNALERLGTAKMIIFKPEKVKHSVTIFTDIDCAFCRKLHQERKTYLARGIQLQYLFYPRAGQRSASYHKAVSVWCADNRLQALTKAKQGKKLESQYCEHPIDEHIKLAGQMGISSAPVLLLDTGELLPTYLPAEQLQAVLKDRKRKQAQDLARSQPQ